MSERLQRALRELSAALEETTWDVVSPTSSSVSGTTVAASVQASSEGKGKGPRARARAVGAVAGGYTATVETSGSAEKPVRKPTVVVTDTTASAVAYHEDVRHYVVLSNPRDPSFVGWTAGPAATTWRRLEAKLPGGQLSDSAVRLRRVESKRAAEELWKQYQPGRLPILPL